jgi:hypothetical protein
MFVFWFLKSSPTTHLWRRRWKRMYSSYSFSTSALDGVSGQRHAPGKGPPGTHCTGGWVGPRAGLDTDVRGKILCLCQVSNLDRPVNQSVARHYTDWATRLISVNYSNNIRWTVLQIMKFSFSSLQPTVLYELVYSECQHFQERATLKCFYELDLKERRCPWGFTTYFTCNSIF